MDVKGGADSRDEWMKEARRHDQSMFRYCEKWQENGTGEASWSLRGGEGRLGGVQKGRRKQWGSWKGPVDG